MQLDLIKQAISGGITDGDIPKARPVTTPATTQAKKLPETAVCTGERQHEIKIKNEMG